MTSRRTGFRTYRSNRTEVLCDQLAKVTATPLSDPMAPELVVVQGRGMELWLNQRLAKQHGIWSNAEYVYPKNFATQILAWAGASDTSPTYSPEAIGWVLLRKIPELAEKPGFGGLGRYLADDVDGLKLFQLAERLADTFDQYLTFRPDMLREWDGVPPVGRRRKEGQLDLFGPVGTRAEDAAWQSALWRVLVAELGERHPAAIELSVLGRLSSPEPLLGVPERVSVFGISTLPPGYVRLLLALSAHTEVHLFLLSPCREFWDDLSRRDIRTEPESERLPAAELLAALGQQGAEFQRVVSKTAEELGVDSTTREEDLFVEPGTDTTLRTLQHEMLTLSRAGAPDDVPVIDDSITVLSCHSPMREVEVLSENLMDLLATRRGYRPEDIVVMAPNIEDYAPLVEAVMARQRHGKEAIPYTIADRSVRADSAVIDAVLGALRLSGSRVTASEVLDLLKLEVVHRRFSLDATDVELLAEWVVAANIRWGIDGAHRESFGQPGVSQNTWEFGLTRLLLGTALAPRGTETFQGVHPFADVEGTLALTVGKLAEYCDALFSALGSLSGEKSLREWQACLGHVLDTLVAAEPAAAWQHEQLRKTLDELASSAERAGFTGMLGRPALLALLERDLDQRLPARGFLSGGVTFCAMVPMRSIPFKVVYLLGLNDAVFPRHTRAPDFDLIRSGKSRDGDRSRRKDDRNLFLESILAARERLYLSYVGQSVRDNAELPPSVVLSELIDCLVAGATRNLPDGSGHVVPRKDAGKAALARLLIRHPLQPFSQEYFADPEGRLWTFQEEYAGAAQSLVEAPAADPPFLSEGLPPPETLELVTLTELARFFRSPAQFLMTARLGVFIGENSEDVPDREPIELDELEHYGVGENVLALLSRGCPEEDLQATLTAQGDLPFRSLGRRELDRVLQSARAIAKLLRGTTAGGSLPSLWLDRTLPSGARLQGTISNRYASGIVRNGFARVRSKKLLEVWIEHLGHCLESPGATSTLIGRPAKAAGAHVATFQPVADPAAALDDLIQCFRAGQSEALPFFPEASLSFAKDQLSPKPTKGSKRVREASGQGLSSFLGEDLKWNPYLQRLLGEERRVTAVGPVGFAPPRFARFDELAMRVCGPLLAHLDEVTAQAATAEERPEQEERAE